MTPRQRTWAGIGGVVAGFILLAAMVAALLPGNFRVLRDQESFHLPTIRQFQQQWPRPDLHDYPVSTSPGYHLALAATAVYVRDDLLFLRLAGAAFSVALVLVAAWAASRKSVWLALPLACSFYVMTSTVWLLSENAAWLWVLVGLLIALRLQGKRLILASAVLLAVLVFFRQSHAWMIGVFAVAVLTGENEAGRLSIDRRPGRWLAALVAVLPAVLVLAGLVSLWHGMVPPSFQPGKENILFEGLPSGGFAPGAPAYLLTLVGGFGLFFLGWIWPEENARRPAMVGAFIGLVLGVIPASSYLFPVRYSGYWPIIQKCPTYFDRSPLFVGLAILGGLIAAVALWRQRPRDRLILGTALAGMATAQMATPYLWQRYYEPFVLIWLMLAAASPTERPPSYRRRGLQWAGLSLLVLVQLAICWTSLQNNR